MTPTKADISNLRKAASLTAKILALQKRLDNILSHLHIRPVPATNNAHPGRRGWTLKQRRAASRRMKQRMRAIPAGKMT